MGSLTLPLQDATRAIGADAQRLIKTGVFLTRVIVERVVDDRDGDDVTVDFSYRGIDYQIDLSAKNARALDQLLAPYLQVARRTKARPAPATRSVRSERSYNVKAVRAWARSQGIEIAERGRVSADVLKQYQDAFGR